MPARSMESPTVRLQALWRRLSPIPGGRWLFSRILGRIARYTGSMGAVVDAFEPGRVRIRLRDRPAVRNHLRSIHAVALSNLGELATGLAILSACPPTTRGILVALETAYLKKARGTLVATAEVAPLEVSDPREEWVEADIRDEAGDVVATVRARWRLGPTPVGA
jgi:acyl-coenzyme A thioesterase PaaI-like protein